jgi:hypothetical protein
MPLFEGVPAKKSGIVVANGFRNFGYTDSELADSTQVDALEARLNSRFSAKSGGEHTLGFIGPEDMILISTSRGGSLDDQFIEYESSANAYSGFIFNFPMNYSGRAIKLLFYSYGLATGIADYTLKFSAFEDGIEAENSTFGPTYSFSINYTQANKAKLSTLIVPTTNLGGAAAGTISYIRLERLTSTDANNNNTYFMGAEIREVAA